MDGTGRRNSEFGERAGYDRKGKMWLSPEAGSPQTSTLAREEAVHAWSTSAAAVRPLHWWPPMPDKQHKECCQSYSNWTFMSNKGKFK